MINMKEEYDKNTPHTVTLSLTVHIATDYKRLSSVIREHNSIEQKEKVDPFEWVLRHTSLPGSIANMFSKCALSIKTY